MGTRVNPQARRYAFLLCSLFYAVIGLGREAAQTRAEIRAAQKEQTHEARLRSRRARYHEKKAAEKKAAREQRRIEREAT
jgi:hypothetical protein